MLVLSPPLPQDGNCLFWELRMSSDMCEEPLEFLAKSLAYPLAALSCGQGPLSYR